MKYCPKCASIVSDKSNSRFATECWNCHIPYEEDEMTGDEFENLSETEKENYTVSLLNKIKKSPLYDETACYYGHPDFYYSYWFEKYEELMNVDGATAWRADRIETEEEMQKRLDELYGKNSPAYQKAILEQYKQAAREKNIPRCPICQSTNLSKISAVQKGIKVGLFGIFGAGDIGKTYQCNNCKSRF